MADRQDLQQCRHRGDVAVEEDCDEPFPVTIKADKITWELEVGLKDAGSTVTGTLQNGNIVWSDGDEWESLAFYSPVE